MDSYSIHVRSLLLKMISLLHPSRGRPHQSRKTYESWMQKSLCYQTQSGEGYEYVLSCDFDDPSIKEYLKINYPRCIDNNESVVMATNKAARNCRGDILVYMSDDFDCPEHWDALLIDEFKAFGDRPALLKVDDCLQPFHVGVTTIPIMNRALYNLLGYFWNPLYKSMHVDVDLYETCKRIGAIRNAPHLKFPHNHYSNGKAPRDETYTRSEGNWNQGLEVINRRRAEGFPI